MTPVLLPYMGPPKSARAKPVAREINMSALSDNEQRIVDEQISVLDDPYVTYTKKVTRLAELLDCDEATAERIFMNRL